MNYGNRLSSQYPGGFVMRALIVLSIFLLSLINFADVQKVSVGINGMTCMGCVNSITEQFKSLPQVEAIEVDLKTKKATVTLKEGQNLSKEEIQKSLDQAGGYKLESLNTASDNS